MQYLVICLIFLALTSTLCLHITTEAQFIRRVTRAGELIERLLDHNQQEHINIIQSTKKLSLNKQVRILEYYTHILDPNFNQYSSERSNFQRMERIEEALNRISPEYRLKTT